MKRERLKKKSLRKDDVSQRKNIFDEGEMETRRNHRWSLDRARIAPDFLLRRRDKKNSGITSPGVPGSQEKVST